MKTLQISIASCYGRQAHSVSLGSSCRSGEITTMSDSSYDSRSHLSFDDIAVDNPAAPSILQVHLKVSKTDPFRKGIDVYIGRTNNDLCPVAAMMAYLAERGNTPGALFRFKDGRCPDFASSSAFEPPSQGQG